jgi:hypothetical protein
MKTIICFYEQLARQVEKQLKEETPNNKWSEGYLIDIIKLCCQGDNYFMGHHGAFDLYLSKMGLRRMECFECGILLFANKDEDYDFCGTPCEMDFTGGQA